MKQGRKIKTEGGDPLFQQAAACFRRGDLVEAERLTRNLLSQNIDHPNANHLLGLIAIQSGQTDSAVPFIERAIKIDPQLVTAHNVRGSVLKDLGRLEEALSASERALRLEPQSVDACTNLGLVQVELKNFEEAMASFKVDELEYSVPQQLFDAVSPHLGDSSRNLDILDLGCGTGLCGVAFAPRTNSIIGVDLAPQMLAKSKERGLYTKLVQADICQALEQGSQKFDLVVSADVFIYIGKLDQAFTLVSQRLSQGGLFAFSVEIEETEDYRLTSTGRYAQSSAYIQRLSEANCFEVMSCTSINVRNERGVPVPGKIFVLRLPLEP